MKKRLVNKKVKNDIIVQLWKKSMTEHMNNIIHIEHKYRFMYGDNWWSHISKLDKISYRISGYYWDFDTRKLRDYCKHKYHFNSTDFYKLK